MNKTQTRTFEDFAVTAAAVPGVVSVTINNSGYRVALANGHAVSVQLGPLNYCDNYDRFDLYDQWYEAIRSRKSRARYLSAWSKMTTTAEIALIHPEGGLVVIGGDETVRGYVLVDEVVAFIAEEASHPMLHLPD